MSITIVVYPSRRGKGTLRYSIYAAELARGSITNHVIAENIPSRHDADVMAQALRDDGTIDYIGALNRRSYPIVRRTRIPKAVPKRIKAEAGNSLRRAPHTAL